MQTMKQTWKKSLAALALLTALGPDGDRVTAQPASGQSVAASQGVYADAQPEPGDSAKAGFAVQIATQDRAPGASSVAVSRSGASSESLVDSAERLSRLTMSTEQQAVEETLMRIKVDSVKYDGLPLGEVVNNLIEIASKQDHNGLNFVLNREVPSGTAVTIDPATGLPAPAQPGSDDLNSITVHINPTLKNVRMIDVLDAITKTADRPIHFTIEDYGVLFSLGPKPKMEARQMMLQDRLGSIVRKSADSKLASVTGRAVMARDFAGSSPILEVMTFKIDTNTFFANMERTFGEQLLNNRPSQIRATLMDVFQKSFGIKFEGQNKAVFYNDANGVIMVRGTAEDVAAMRGAIEMLGGTPYPAQSSIAQRLQRLDSGSRVNGGGGGTSAGSTTAGGGGGGTGGEQPGNR